MPGGPEQSKADQVFQGRNETDLLYRRIDTKIWDKCRDN